PSRGERGRETVPSAERRGFATTSRVSRFAACRPRAYTVPMPGPRRIARDAGGTRRASEYIRERAAGEGGELTRVKRALAERGLSPRRRFGQNFLVREDLAERIVEHAHLREDDVAVEIGPGAGALTGRIAARVRQLIAIEKDTGLAA